MAPDPSPTPLAPPMEEAAPSSPGRVLLVDDEAGVRLVYGRALTDAGHLVECAADGAAAANLLSEREYDVILSDIRMPDMNGLDLLRRVRELDLDVPVVLMTAGPALDTALEALEFGAMRYLPKPVEIQLLRNVIARGVRLHRMARLKRRALALVGALGMKVGDIEGLEKSLERALESAWIAYQPIVAWSQRRIFGYEALLRSREPELANPLALFEAAERLGRLPEVGRSVRARVARAAGGSTADWVFFMNLHPRDLLDPALFEPASPLTAIAKRVVLEITERASLHEVVDLRARIARLRAFGFRIAIDDLGAGYAGLTSFTLIEPEIVKLDLALVQAIDRSSTAQKLVRSMVGLCKEMNTIVIAEGVETVAERDVLAHLGCDLLQGHLFARPGDRFPAPAW